MSDLDLTRRVLEIEDQIVTPQTVEVPAGVDPIGHTHSNFNAIINGDANIWERGTSFAAVANGDYTADRFHYGKTSAAVHRISRSTDVPTQAESGHLSNYSIKIDCTTADATVAAGDLAWFSQRVEGFNFAPLVGDTAYLSFWVKATKTGIYCVALGNSGSDRSFVSEFTVNSSETWERKSITIPFDFTGGTWDYVNGIGLRTIWTLMSGSTFLTTADAWQNGNFFATANQVNACDSTANDFYLSKLQLRKDNPDFYVPTRLIDDELVGCQRYWEILGGDNALNAIQLQQYVAGVTFLINTVFYQKKRTVPTVTKNGTWAVTNCGQPIVDQPARSTCRIYATSSGAGNTSFTTNSTDDTITVDAEL